MEYLNQITEDGVQSFKLIIRLLITVVIASFFSTGIALASDAKIFVLHSYHQDYPWTKTEHEGFVQSLNKEKNYIISTEYLDTKRIVFDFGYQEFFAKYLQQKYPQPQYIPDIIFCTDDNALTFMRLYKQRVFGNSPVVFSGINNLAIEKELDQQQYTGIFENKEVAPNLKLLEKIYPTTKKIIFLGDNSSTHKAIEKNIRGDIATKFPNIGFSFLSSSRLSYVVNKLKSEKKGVVILTSIGGMADDQGFVQPLPVIISSLVGSGDFTIISMEDVYMEEGVLGGYVTSGFFQGKEAAHLVNKILQGEHVSSIPTGKDGLNVYKFNYNQLQREQIAISKLPKDSIILNQPHTLYSQYKKQFLMALIFFIIQIIIIFALIINIMKRRRAESNLKNAHDGLEEKVEERTAELDQINKALYTEKEKIDRYLNIAGVMILVLDSDQRVTLINNKGCEILGAPREDVVGKNWFDNYLPHRVRQDVKIVYDKIINGEEELFEYFENEILTKDGNERRLFWHNAKLLDDEGNITGVLCSGEDITERRELERKLNQAQKMEAIGTLAGGIAHDFNNILSSIIGFSELAKDSIPSDNPAQKDIDHVLKSSTRAVNLVKQILTFSRHERHQLQTLMPYLIVKETLMMLRSSLPTTLSLEEDIDPNCGTIQADPTNIHQIVLNLCTNSLHAMENEKGTLGVRLYRKDLEAETIRESDVSPGPFIVLSVSDTGQGMDKNTIKRIFEPYFTTKEVGKGTGLGLAVIHGIVKYYGGFIEVETELGKGSVFHVYFPAIEKTFETQAIAEKKLLPTGNERILIVDDESSIINLQETILERLDYTVTATTDSNEALEKFCLQPDQFDLIITDQTMPSLSGVEFAEEVLKIKADMPIILCTGYSSIVTEEEALALGIKKYVRKPVDRSTLTDIVRQVLDEG